MLQARPRGEGACWISSHLCTLLLLFFISRTPSSRGEPLCFEQTRRRKLAHPTSNGSPRL